MFNFDTEVVFNEVLEDRDVGVKVNRVHLNNMRYADGSVLLADTIADLHNFSKSCGLKINSNKMKLMMIVSRRKIPYENTQLA